MATTAERRAALDALLANQGRGQIGENDIRWAQVVQPALAAPDAQSVNRAEEQWAVRNDAIARAASEAVAGFGGALEAARQKELALQLAKRGGGRRSGGGGSAPEETVTSSGPVDPWAWLDDWVAKNTYTPPTAPGQRKAIPSRGGGGFKY